MDVKIEGPFVHQFRIEVTDNLGNVTHYNMHDELLIHEEDLEKEIQEISAKEHFWAQMAIFAENAQEEFEKTWYAVYRAHVEQHVRWYLAGSGEKAATNTARDRIAYQLFGRDQEAETRQRNITLAYKGYTYEQKNIGIDPKSLAVFEQVMYSYEQSIEDVELMLVYLKKRAQQLRAVANAFSAKAWSLKTLAAMRRSMLGAHIA